MKYYRFPENRLTKLVLAGYLFVMLYLCYDSMMNNSVIGFYPSYAITIGLTVIFGLGFLIYQRRNWKALFTDSRMLVAAGMAVAILLPMVLKADWQLMYATFLFSIFVAIFLSYFVTWRELAKSYVIILCILGVYSLLANWILFPMVGAGIFKCGMFINGVGANFCNFWLANVPITYSSARNWGIFREPGVYQFFIMLALFLTHEGVSWKKERTKWAVTAILCTTMLTTFATGGIIEMGLFLGYLLLEKKFYKNKAFIGVLIAGALLVACYIWYCYTQDNSVWRKFYRSFYGKFVDGSGSFEARLDSVFLNLDVVLKNPLLGGKLSDILYSLLDNTNSTMILFAAYGLVFGWLHAVCWTILVWDKKRSLFGNLLLMVIMFMSFNTQNLTWDLFFWLLPVMALTEKLVPLLDKWRSEKKWLELYH